MGSRKVEMVGGGRKFAMTTSVLHEIAISKLKRQRACDKLKR